MVERVPADQFAHDVAGLEFVDANRTHIFLIQLYQFVSDCDCFCVFLQLLERHSGRLPVCLSDEQESVLLLKSEQQLLHSSLSDVYGLAHEAAPVENCVLKPGREEKREAHEAVETCVESLLLPEVFVLKYGYQFGNRHNRWQNEQECVETAPAGNPRHNYVSRNASVGALDPNVEQRKEREYHNGGNFGIHQLPFVEP